MSQHIITTFQLAVIVLSPWLAIALACVFIARKVDRLSRATSGHGPVPPQATSSLLLVDDDHLIYVRLAVAIVLVSIVVVYMPADFAPSDVVTYLGLREVHEDRPLAVWQSDENHQLGRFQWHAFDIHNETRYPILECAMYDNAHALQMLLLGDLPEASPSDALDPVRQRNLLEKRREEVRLRRRASQRCVLPPAEEHLLLDVEDMDHLIAADAPSLYQLVRDSRSAAFPAVDSILLARDGTRYYRVHVAVRNGTRTRIEPRIVSEDRLLQAPRDWYRYFCQNRAFNVGPCICPAHFGIVNSSLFFLYPGLDRGESSDQCDRPWRLWAHARHVRAISGAAVGISDVQYVPYPSAFPLQVMQKLNITSFLHAEINAVEYMDIERVVNSPRGSALLGIHEPEWIADDAHGGIPSAVDADGISPLLAVVPLHVLLGDQPAPLQTLSSDLNACFHLCLHMDELIMRQILEP